MKIIVSHDVDHLYSKDHWFRDLFFPKLWFRETKNLLSGAVPYNQWLRRCCSCFKWRLNNIASLIEFDQAHHVPSTFFFGMSQGLNMSYKPKEAKKMIDYVIEHELSVGVHGIAFDDEAAIRQERERFINVIGFTPKGIRMHYVRNAKCTQDYLSKAGYQYDSSFFDKEKGYSIVSPYVCNGLVEFPVCIMDSYLEGDLKLIKAKTQEIIDFANNAKLEYFVLLFHDVYYTKAYLDYMNWYEWIIRFFEKDERYSFVSFEDALNALYLGNENEP